MDWRGRQLNYAWKGTAMSVYTYDADGLRTKKTQSNGTVSNYYYVNGRLAYEKRGDKELYYVYDQLGNLFYIRYVYGASDLNYYVATNSRGDVETIYTGPGAVKAHYTYDTWGKIVSITDANGNAITDPDNIGLVNPIRYRGYYYDDETGFYYLQSRYYDPDTGRFLNADDASLLGANGDFSSYNLYAYCGNNPVMRKDMDGAFWEEAIAVSLIVVVIALAVIAALPTGGTSLGAGAAATVAIVGKVATASAAAGLTVAAGATAGKAIEDSISYSKFGPSKYGGYEDDEVAGRERIGRQNGNAPRSNKAQNKQFDYSARDLNKAQRRRLHDTISKRGFGFEEILEEKVRLFK